jgi:hypothetical protein
MKKLLILFTTIVALLAGGILLFGAAKPTEQEATPATSGNASTSIAIENSVQSGIPFHVYFPTLGNYEISANPNLMHFEDGIMYSVEASSGDWSVTVNEGLVSSTIANHFITIDQLRSSGSVSTTSADGVAGYIGIINKGLTAGHAAHVLVFVQRDIVTQLSTFDPVDFRVLVDLANSMK